MNVEELQIALPVLWPSVLIALAVALAAWWPWRNSAKRSEPVFGAYWAGALAVGCAFVVSFLVILKGWPGFQPKQSWQWLLNIGAAATLAGVIGSVFKSFAPRLAIACVLACAIALFFHAPRAIESQWIWKTGVAIASLTMWLALDPVASRRPGISIPLCMLILFGGASVLMKESRSANLSLAAASCSAAWGSIALVALFNSRLKVSRSAMYVVAALWPALLALGEFDRRGGVPGASFIIIALAPLALWLAEFRMFTNYRPWQMVIVRAGLVGIPVAISIALAMRASHAEDS